MSLKGTAFLELSHGLHCKTLWKMTATMVTDGRDEKSVYTSKNGRGSAPSAWFSDSKVSIVTSAHRKFELN